jgi:predicted RNase H-like nuclease (RuvC/YqgF family)
VILSENSSQQKQLENSSEHIKELMQEIYNLQADLRRKKEQVEEMEQEMGLT